MSSIRLKSLIRFLLTCLLYSLTTAAKGTGTRGSGGGGDPIVIQMDVTRRQMVMALDSLNKAARNPYTQEIDQTFKNHLKDICQSKGIRLDALLNTCADFLITAAPQILRCNPDTNHTPVLVLDVDDQEARAKFKVQYELANQPVAAHTGPSCSDPIVFDYDRIRRIEPEYIFMTLAHEFGHKVVYQASPDTEAALIDDAIPVGGFRNGAELLNLFGEVLYGYYAEFVSLPTTPKPGPELYDQKIDKDFFLCQISDPSFHSTAEPGKTRTFRFYNTRRTTGPDEYTSESRTTNAFGIDVTDLLPASSHTIGRQVFLNARFSEGGGCSVMSDLDATSITLISYPQKHPGLSPAQRMSDLIAHDDNGIEHTNRLCPSDNPSPTFMLSYDETIMSCVYEGLQRY